MRFIHIADVHLGAEPDRGYPWGARRGKEIWESFRSVIQRAGEEQTDLLLIAGDLFHRQPLKREIKEVDSLLAGLVRTKVVMIAGNHDYIRNDSYYRNYEWSPNVTFLRGAELESVYFPELQTEVYGFSYHSQEIRENLYDEIRPQRPDRINILLAHGGDDNHIPVRKDLPAVSGFDYIALGHIHKPGMLASGRMAYAGALEPIDMNDTGPHGYISGEIANGQPRITFVRAASREYLHKEWRITPEDTFETVRAGIRHFIEENSSHNIYKIILRGQRDPDIFLDQEELQTLGNIIRVEDGTEPDLDYEKLEREHGDDLVGRYIRRLRRMPDSRINEDALYYGVYALLRGQR